MILQDGRMLPSETPVIDLIELEYFKKYPLCYDLIKKKIAIGEIRLVPSMEYCFEVK